MGAAGLADRARELFELFDTDGSGHIDHTEVMMALAGLADQAGHLDGSVTSETSLRLVFALLDADGSGYLTMDEVFSLLRFTDLNLEEEGVGADVEGEARLDVGKASQLAEAFVAMDTVRVEEGGSGWGLAVKGVCALTPLSSSLPPQDFDDKVSYEEFRAAVQDPKVAKILFAPLKVASVRHLDAYKSSRGLNNTN